MSGPGTRLHFTSVDTGFDAIAAAASAGVLGALPKPALRRLAGDGQLIVVLRRHRLFQQGDEPRRLFLILAGKLRLTHQNPQGRDFLLGIAGPGTVADLEAVVGDAPCFASGEMATAGRVLRFEAKALKDLLAREPGLARAVERHLCAVLRETWARCAGLGVKYGKEILAEHLVAHFGLKPPYREPARPLVANVNRTDIAQRTGMAKETVSRLLKGLVRKKVIAIQGRAIRILSVKALAQTAGVAR